MSNLCHTSRDKLEGLRAAATKLGSRLHRQRTWWDFVIDEDTRFRSYASSLMEHAKELCAKLQQLQERPNSSKENLEGSGVSKLDVHEKQLEIQVKKLSADLESEKAARSTAERELNRYIDLHTKADSELNRYIDLNTQAKRMLEAINDQLQTKTGELATKEEDLEAKERELTTVKEQLATVQEKLLATEKDLQTADEALETAGAQLKTTKEKLADTEGELEKAKQAASSLLQELATRSKERDDAMEAKDKTEKELKTTTAKYDNRRRKVQ